MKLIFHLLIQFNLFYISYIETDELIFLTKIVRIQKYRTEGAGPTHPLLSEKSHSIHLTNLQSAT